MYKSILLIDTGDNPDRLRPARSWLRNIYTVHQRLCMAFPSKYQKQQDELFIKRFNPESFGVGHVHLKRSGNSGFLYRIEHLQGGRHLITVQSPIPPDWDYAFKNASYLLAAPPEVHELNHDIKDGYKYTFHLVCNPVKRLATPKGEKPGKRVPVSEELLDEWLNQQGKRKGFRIDKITHRQNGFYTAYKKTQDTQIKFKYTRFLGYLTVTDTEMFQETLASGIGAGKAFGMGLLTINQVEKN